MRKRYLRLAAVLCALIYAAAVGTALYRIIARASDLEFIAAGEFKELVEKATAAASLGFPDGPFFRESIRGSLERSKAIAAIIVTGPNGPEYAVEREGGYIANAGEAPTFSSRFDITPSPMTASLRLESVRNATVSAAVYRIIPEELIAVLRDSLLAILVPLFAAVFLFLFSSSDRKASAEKAGGDTAQFKEMSSERKDFNDDFDIPDIAEDVAAVESSSPEPTAMPQSGCGEKPAGLYDGILGWEEYLEERLDAELRRAASFEQDLVLLTVESDMQETQTAEKYKLFAENLVDFFSFKDLSFKRGENGAAIILPNIDIDQGLSIAEKYMLKCRELGGNVEIGLTARAGRLVDARRLLTEAKAALERARKNGQFQIMAFKPDPERYRSFVAANS